MTGAICLRDAGALRGGLAREEEVFGVEVGGVVLGPVCFYGAGAEGYLVSLPTRFFKFFLRIWDGYVFAIVYSGSSYFPVRASGFGLAVQFT